MQAKTELSTVPRCGQSLPWRLLQSRGVGLLILPGGLRLLVSASGFGPRWLRAFGDFRWIGIATWGLASFKEHSQFFGGVGAYSNSNSV